MIKPFKKSGDPIVSSLVSIDWLDSVSLLGETRLPDSGWAVAVVVKRESKTNVGTINFLVGRLKFDIKLIRECQGMESIGFVCRLVEVPIH